MFVKPADPQVQLLLQSRAPQGDQRAMQQLIFQSFDPAFEDGNAAALADRAKARSDALASTPELVSRRGPKLV
jgi:hypothetical protein